MKNLPIIALITLFCLVAAMCLAQAQTEKPILIDIGHNPVFYNDPENMNPSGGQDIERVKYMIGELRKNAKKHDATLDFITGEITTKMLSSCDLLFIHVPSAKYTSSEINAIIEYLEKGGALFVVMDGDYWTTLEKTNINDLMKRFDIKYGGMSPNQTSGGRTEAGLITSKSLNISYHGSRLIDGGTPFCFNNQGKDYPFGVFEELDNGGKIVAMGDGMTSLYMTSWDGVDGYQCREFIHEVLGWLLD